jgi:signal transduction histidine kinase/ligand-binding sensor domain-containing protein
MSIFPRSYRRRAAALLLFGLAGAARALDPAVPLRQLHHDQWTGRDGMPGDVWDMAQCADGTIWFATTSGLFRFDGRRFEAVRSLGGKPLLSTVLAGIRCFADGSLWVGYRYGGVSAYRDGALRQFSDADGLPHSVVRQIARDRGGATWVLTANDLLRFDGARWRKVGADWGLPARLRTLEQDASGALLAFDAASAYRLDEGARRFVPTAIPTSPVGTIIDERGQLWSDADRPDGKGAQLTRVGAGQGGVAPATARENLPHAGGPLFDRDGNLWTAEEGLAVMRPADISGRDVLLPPGGEMVLPPLSMSARPMTILEDREGNIWTGTRLGVDRFRHNRLLPLALPDGTSYLTFALDGEGGLWATGGGVDGKQLWRVQRDGALVLQPDRYVTTLASASDGALLVSGDGYIERRGKGGAERIAFPDGVPRPGAGSRNYGARLLLGDADAVWASFAFNALYRYADGHWRRAATFGLPDYAPNSIGRGRDGALWFGYRDDEVFALRGEKLRRYGRADGLDIGIAGSLFDAGDALLAGGDRGLAMLDGARFRPVVATDPDALAGVTGMLRGADGDLWINGGKGLVHITAAAWRAWRAAPPGTPVALELFDALDGYPGIAQFRAGQASLVQDREGRIWIAGSNGAARIDPRRLYRNTVAPPLQVRALLASGQAASLASPVLAPGTSDVQIDYAAASYTMPERVRFRYRLDGVDAGWRDAGDRRTAYYTRLDPGSYVFRVIAANEDGVWNTDGARIAFSIRPTFVQGVPFKLLCAALLLAGAWLLHRLRLRRATMQLRRLLQERANERERIARILHDTLMQSVQALLMLFERARDTLPPERAEQSLLDRTLALARTTISEGRDELSALRGAAGVTGDLAGALTPVALLLGEQYGVGFEVVISDDTRVLRHGVAHEASFIAREALQNAFRHAGASKVVLELDFGARFSLRVRDDGRGMAHHAGGSGHWGLIGMRERAAALGATLDLDAADGGGSVVALSLDGRKAYDSGGAWPFWTRLRRRLFKKTW